MTCRVKHPCPGCGGWHHYLWEVAFCDRPQIDDDVPADDYSRPRADTKKDAWH